MKTQHLIAGYSPPRDREMRELFSHLSPASVVLTFIICGAILAYFFRGRR